VHDSDGPIRQELIKEGIQCVDLNFLSRRSWTRKISYPIEVYRFLKQYNVSALLLHHATSLILCGVAARLARVKRIVLVEHSVHQFRDQPDHQKKASIFFCTAHRIIAVDRSILDYFHHYMHVPSERLSYIPNGIKIRPPDTQAALALRHTLGIQEKDFIFLFAGRLQPVKDVATLIRAIAQIPDLQRVNIRLLIAGDGAERGTLERASTESGLNNTITFLGPRNDIPNLMNAADAFVMSSITEGQPMALLEAMAARLPCIATAVGGIPELLGSDRGCLVAPKDTPEFARRMVFLKNNSLVSSVMAEKSLEYVKKHHSIELVASEYLHQLINTDT